MPRQLIQCGHDGLAPCGVVCIHLVSGESDEWRPVADLDAVVPRLEVENDWLCPECAAKWPDLSIDDIMLACIHCIRQLRTDGQDRHSATDC